MPSELLRKRPFSWLIGLAIFAILAAVFHVLLGSSDPTHYFHLRISPGEVFTTLFAGPNEEGSNFIVWNLRLPRTVACLCAGGVLGFVGSAFQALFRNPLAEPYIVGSASGAAVGGAAALVGGFSVALGGLGMIAAAFVTGLLALGLVMLLSSIRGHIDPQRLLLAGVVTSSMLASLVAVILLAAGQDSNQVLRWLLGSMTPMMWTGVGPMAIAMVLGGGLLILQSKRLNAFAMGEDVARRVGVDIHRLKPNVLVVGTAMTAIVVGTVGIIGFLGMVAPHIARKLIGVDWRYSLAASGFVGAAMLTLADVVAQWAVPGAELPVGIVTALIGAPALLWLLRRSPTN